MIVPAQPTLTVEQFYQRHGGELGVDLVRGQLVRYPMPEIEHGRVCASATIIFGQFIREKKLGRVMSNDTLIRTGPDVCFASYFRLSAGVPPPKGVMEFPPDLVVEFRSPSDLWTEALTKMIDYLKAGVPVVVILDLKTESASIFRSNDRPRIFEKHETLTLPDVLPGFAVPVAQFFEE